MGTEGVNGERLGLPVMALSYSRVMNVPPVLLYALSDYVTLSFIIRPPSKTTKTPGKNKAEFRKKHSFLAKRKKKLILKLFQITKTFLLVFI